MPERAKTTEFLTLREAVEVLSRETGRSASYVSYRDQAKRRGRVHFTDSANIAVLKIGRAWMVERVQVTRAREAIRSEREVESSRVVYDGPE